MPTGSGFALGPQYERKDIAGGRFSVEALAGISSRGWKKFEMAVTAPKLQSGRLMLDLRAARHDYISLPFYGQGPNSDKQGRTNYRLEDTTLDALAGMRLSSSVMFGASAGYQAARVRAGEDPRYASADAVYPSSVQAFGQQTDFVRFGSFVQMDNRDNRAGPRQGGLYSARFDDYRARSGRPYSFQRVDVELQKYIPLFNQRRVIALHARTIQSFSNADNQTPFFQQAVLGGNDDLRGFRPYRFQDDNMFVTNAEYRWEVFSGLDMAVFADAGRVSPRHWDIHLHDLETDAGFGLRFNARNATFLRVDVGFSHEGFQVFVKFNNVFHERRLGSSSAAHIY
jgi:outer membrane protein assembly factor BamA